MFARLSGLAIYTLAFGVYPLLPATRDSGAIFSIFCACHVLLGLCLLPTLARGLRRRTLLFLLLFIVPRLALMPMQPWLSDDVWRYLWDGAVVLDGKNVYLYTPEDAALEHLRADVYAVVDYRDIYTIYPPLAQYGFGLAVAAGNLFGGGAWAQLICLKLLLIGTEFLALLILMRLLRHRRFAHAPPSVLGLYVLSPLPAIEFAGQAHLDAWLLLPLAVLLGMVAATSGFKLVNKQKAAFKVGLAITAAALVKILPAALLGLWWRKLKDKRSRLILLGTSGGLLILASAPYFHDAQAFVNIAQTVSYYSNVMQFNGVPLYLINATMDVVGAANLWPSYWEWTPRLLSAVRVLAIILLILVLKVNSPRKMVKAMFWVLCAVLLLSTKVHTWYFGPLLLLNVFIGYRWLPFFAGMSMLSYLMYAVTPWREAYAVQYIVWAAALLFMLWEIYIQPRIAAKDLKP